VSIFEKSVEEMWNTFPDLEVVKTHAIDGIFVKGSIGECAAKIKQSDFSPKIPNVVAIMGIGVSQQKNKESRVDGALRSFLERVDANRRRGGRGTDILLEHTLEGVPASAERPRNVGP
jgi:hypothetical protein